MNDYKPPYETTEDITYLVAEICELIGSINVLHGDSINPHLRRENRIRTIHSSLAIENNTLTLDQVTDIINGKRVLGNPNEIKEVKNAYAAYELMLQLDPESVEDLLRAHKLMMSGLVDDNGKFRSEAVGIYAGKTLVHMAPPAKYVSGQIKDLFKWYTQSELHPLIKSAVFHYEFEFIHPFMDGNGRMGRMWHSLLLGQWREVFLWLPMEELIQSRQQEYYDALGQADRSGTSTEFVKLMLEIIKDSLAEIKMNTDQVTDQVSDQVKKLINVLGDDVLSASELMNQLGLSHRATFRKNYLNPALEVGLIERTVPDKPTSRNQKYRKIK